MSEQIIVERTTTERLEITTPQSLCTKAFDYLTRSGYAVIDSVFVMGPPTTIKTVGEKVVTTEPQIISAVALDSRVIGG